LLNQIITAKEQFGPKCGKYAGAVTVEVFRCALMNNGYSVSPRDSFVRGIPIEVDMLIVRPDAAPQHNCLYQPPDVLAAVEVKNYGSFGDSTIAATKANFDRITGATGIRCCYVSLAERRRYKWAITSENIGYPAFTIFTHTGSKDIRYHDTGDWQRFLTWLAKLGS
jgi:hypothetical protein